MQGESQLQVLVQWKWMHLDDTTWEDWASLKATHHLEDKVLPDGLGNDRPITENIENNHDRSKRRTMAPSYLKDYV